MQEERRGDRVIIFDYDDTMFPSTYLRELGLTLSSDISSIPPGFFDQTKELADIVSDTVNHASTLGDIYLVTNGEQGWVELSSCKFMPSLASCLIKFKRIISARGRYESTHPNDPIMWKKEAFSDIIRDYVSYAFVDLGYNFLMPIDQSPLKTTHLISIGDSLAEREAAIMVYKEYGGSNLVCKTLKFFDSPTCEQLKLEMMLVRISLEQIVNHPFAVDVQINISKNAESDNAECSSKCPSDSPADTTLPPEDPIVDRDECSIDTETGVLVSA